MNVFMPDGLIFWGHILSFYILNIKKTRNKAGN